MIKLLRKLRAFINRTFVTDCPRCQKFFYGFHPYKTHVKLDKKHYRYVCHRCTQELQHEA